MFCHVVQNVHQVYMNGQFLNDAELLVLVLLTVNTYIQPN